MWKDNTKKSPIVEFLVRIFHTEKHLLTVGIISLFCIFAFALCCGKPNGTYRED